MEPLLKTVAREYAKRYPDLKEICFLFTNKRCGKFLRKYFYEFGIITEDLPHILTISEFVEQTAYVKEASKIEQLFILFKAYLELGISPKGEKLPETPEALDAEFEKFRNWGETVLNDFNTVDIYLGNSSEIFKNVRDFKELTSNFLTEEQKEVMREYFGVIDFDEYKSFWKKFEDPAHLSPLKKDFISLWQVLGPLYIRFHEKLKELKLGSSGSIYRKAAQRIEEEGKSRLVYKKIVVVGFNALTESERIIFKTLKNEKGEPGYDNFIDFVWDLTGPLLTSGKFSASRFVRYNLKHFPMPQWLLPAIEAQEVTSYPRINIVSAPSNTAQTKVAGEYLKEFTSPKSVKMIREAEAALILPDEGLLTNVLFSVPDNIADINLTMGYSLKNTSIAAYLNSIRGLFKSIQEGKEGRYFLVKPLKKILSHPYSYTLLPASDIEKLFAYLSQYHKVRVSEEEIKENLGSSGIIFNLPSRKSSGKEVFAYIYNLIDAITEKLKEENSTEENKTPVNEDTAQLEILKTYLEKFETSVNRFEMQLTPETVFNLLEKVVLNNKIGFEGEPLSGLQVMGTLETRSLDFREVIIMSLNEGIMPANSVATSFIPEALRRSYGLPPSHYAEEIFAYYFYRLISRAEKVTLIYDGRVISGLRGGESRYLIQLREFVPNEYIKEIAWQFPLQNREGIDVTVEKSAEVLKLTEPFMANDSTRKNFSASSLNTYRECQVKFFLQNMLNLNGDNPADDYMDAISVGNILHEVMLELYMPKDKQNRLLKDPIVLTADSLQKLIDNKAFIKALIKNKLYKFYYGGEKDPLKIPDSGVTDILQNQIEELIEQILLYDKKLAEVAPLKIYGCEISQNIQVKLSSGRVVNFRFAIDRLDEITRDGKTTLRIVDYKTGARKRKAESIEEVFEGGYKSEQIFQLFTYAWLLDKISDPAIEDVVTEIYYVPDMVKGEDGLPIIGKDKVQSYASFKTEFENQMEAMIESIFTGDKFEMSKDPQVCSYCGFKLFCGK